MPSRTRCEAALGPPLLLVGVYRGQMVNRAYIYIDGFNLHHGAVKRQPQYKWLDLVVFSKRLMAGYDVGKVKYFTAKVRGLGDPERQSRQMVYWRALQHLHPSEFEIVEGRFRIDPKPLREAIKRSDGKYFAGTKSIMVMKVEEKGTDVNLAVHLLNDAWKNLYDTALVVSNDSDLVEAIRVVHSELGKKVVLANPFWWSKKGIARHLMNLGLERRKINETQLAACQLPDEIAGTNLRRPDTWK